MQGGTTQPTPRHSAGRGGTTKAHTRTQNTWNRRQGTTGAGWGREPTTQGTTGPPALPLPFDTQMRMMAMMLCAMTLMCYSQCGCWWHLCPYVARGFGTACSLPYLVENRAWLVMSLRKLYRPLSLQAKFRLGSLNISLSTCLNDFHSGTLEQGTGGECGWGS